MASVNTILQIYLWNIFWVANNKINYLQFVGAFILLIRCKKRFPDQWSIETMCRLKLRYNICISPEHLVTASLCTDIFITFNMILPFQYLKAYFAGWLSLFSRYFFDPIDRTSIEQVSNKYRTSTEQVPNKYRRSTEEMSLQFSILYAALSWK